MSEKPDLVPSFCRFAWHLHERLADENCLDTEQKARLFDVIGALLRAMDAGEVCLDLRLVSTPETMENLKAMLLGSHLVSRTEDNDVLFVLDDSDRLYLHRFYRYEVQLANCLKNIKSHRFGLKDEEFHLTSLFSSLTLPAGNDLQALAVAVAQMSGLTVISGGPGTGKTWTVVKILEALLLREPNLRIAMCAPTGKAAARMSESVRQSLSGVSEQVRAHIPTKAQTVHRLLQQLGQQTFDVVVLDEASMVSLSLMARLVSALSEKTRLICLGDKDQLASVEPGAVFAELSQQFAFTETCRERLASLGFDSKRLNKATDTVALGQQWDLIDHTVWLTKSYRFDDQKGIGLLSRCVREGKASEAIGKLLESDEQLSYFELQGSEGELDASIQKAVIEAYRPYFEKVQGFFNGQNDLDAVFEALHRFGLLCATNEGAFGVDALNDLVVRSQAIDWPIGLDGHFPGEVIMVAVNDYDLRLNNGDIGVVVKSPEGKLVVYFETVDEAGQQTYRQIAVGRLPEHKRAFALTIHKSQGSEFDKVLMILPPKSRLLTRELCYTGITRAKKHLTVVASKEALRRSIQSPTERISGLLSR